MSWNLNNRQNEYELSGKLSAEVIDIYGFQVIVYKTNPLGNDVTLSDVVNFSSNENIAIMAMPENAEAFENRTVDLLNKFGLYSMDTMNLIISYHSAMRICKTLDKIPSIVGNIIQLPSGKYLQVTRIEHQISGINNQFVYNNLKNIFSLHCVPYQYNHDNIPLVDNENLPSLKNEKLDEIFNIVGDNPQSKENVKVKQDELSTKVKGLDSTFGYLE